jgi:hypothetical protein
MHLGLTVIYSDVIGIIKPYFSELLDTVNETLNFLSFEDEKLSLKINLNRKIPYLGLAPMWICIPRSIVRRSESVHFLTLTRVVENLIGKKMSA